MQTVLANKEPVRLCVGRMQRCAHEVNTLSSGPVTRIGAGLLCWEFSGPVTCIGAGLLCWERRAQ